MAAPVTREEFLDVVRRSGILDEESISTFARAARDSGLDFDQPAAVAQRMIRDGLITSFQAKQFLQGRWRRLVLSGKYRILEMLGAGGMGQVFLCRHIYMNRLVALKVLPVDKLKDPSMLDRFYREARAAAALDHPNIVRAYDIDHDISPEEGQKPLHYLVMEFVDGASLQEMVARRGPMDPSRAAHYMWPQAARGLEHAHEAGLVHRDIKPGNLLLDRSGTIKVLDLGLARFFEPGKDNVTERFDEKNAILGTADYLAPEQARGESVDIRADVYSLGATFYFLLTGKAPFDEGTVTQKLLWSQMKAPKPIAERRSGVPEELTAVINRMMAKDPSDRYQTPQAVIEAFAPWTQTPIDPPAPDEMPRRSLAAITPGSPSQVPLLPSTPAPRTLPNDLVPSRPGSGTLSGVKRGGPKTPAPAVAGPMTPLPSPGPKSGPRSGPRSKIVRPPDDDTVREFAPRRKRRREKGLPKWAVFVAAGVGGVLVVVGLFGAYLYNKARRTQPTEETAVTTPAQPRAKASGIVKAGQAGKHLTKRVTVEMTVRRVGKDRSGQRFFLNSKQQTNAADNFVVTFNKQVMDQFAAKGIPNIDAFANKVLRVTGTVTEYQNRAQIEVDSPDQIQLVNK